MVEKGDLQQKRMSQFRNWMEKAILFELHTKLGKYLEQNNNISNPINNTRTLMEKVIRDFIKSEHEGFETKKMIS
jgi:hypothetical protein